MKISNYLAFFQLQLKLIQVLLESREKRELRVCREHLAHQEQPDQQVYKGHLVSGYQAKMGVQDKMVEMDPRDPQAEMAHPDYQDLEEQPGQLGEPDLLAHLVLLGEMETAVVVEVVGQAYQGTLARLERLVLLDLLDLLVERAQEDQQALLEQLEQLDLQDQLVLQVQEVLKEGQEHQAHLVHKVFLGLKVHLAKDYLGKEAHLVFLVPWDLQVLLDPEVVVMEFLEIQARLVAQERLALLDQQVEQDL